MPFHVGLESLTRQIGILTGKIKGFISEKPLQAATALGAGIIIPTSLGIVALRRKKRGKRRRKKEKRRRRKSQGRRKVSRGRHLHKVSRRGKARRHTHRGTKQIHFTKNGQPYILLSSGKARFIKRTSVRRRRKLKGGFY